MSDVSNVIINIVMQLTIIALIFGLAYKFGWKLFIAYIAKRQAVSMEVIKEAEEMKVAAKEMHDAAEQKMREITEESTAIIARTEETAKKIAAERTQRMEDEIARKRELAEKQLQQDRKRLEQQMEHKVLEKATEVASQFLTSKASFESTEIQIEEFLEKLGDE